MTDPGGFIATSSFSLRASFFKKSPDFGGERPVSTGGDAREEDASSISIPGSSFTRTDSGLGSLGRIRGAGGSYIMASGGSITTADRDWVMVELDARLARPRRVLIGEAGMIGFDTYLSLERCATKEIWNTLDEVTLPTGDALAIALGFGSRDVGFEYGLRPGLGILLAAPTTAFLRLEGWRSCEVMGGDSKFILDAAASCESGRVSAPSRSGSRL
jgi:hypothetical protein